MALPSHPGEDDETAAEPVSSGRAKLIAAVIALALGAIVMLHLAGVVGR